MANGGPLAGFKVVEFAALGPVPFTGMHLVDLGAEVTLIDRAGAGPREHSALALRGRKSLALNLKSPQGVELALRAIEDADVLLEGFRPGVMERLGLGPDVCLERNPRLVYGRMTGWGQTGPLAQSAGHDINYIALAGTLAHIGRAGQPPTPPLNLVGDFGGGAMMLTAGVLAALLERQSSGRGQVIDAAMIDGASLLMTGTWDALRAGNGKWGWDENHPGTNMLDSGAPFYDVYQTSDGKYLAVGAIEHQFFHKLMELLGQDPAEFGDHHRREVWPAIRERLTTVFATRTRDEWAAVFEGTDACTTPVLTMSEAAEHPHMSSRSVIISDGQSWHPAPAPRFSRTQGVAPIGTPRPGAQSAELLASYGLSAEEIEKLIADGVVDSPH